MLSVASSAKDATASCHPAPHLALSQAGCQAQPCSPAFDIQQPAIFLNEAEGVAFLLKKLCCSSQR